MTTLLTIFGGVALLVFGVRYLRKGLDRLFGKRLGTWMQRLATRPGWSFLSGIAVSVLAPSSTTMSLLAVHTVRAGHLTPGQMLRIVLGANIGLTIMVMLIALNLQDFAPIVLLAGVALFQFTRGNRSRGIGQVLLAIGFIFLAIGIMKDAAVRADVSKGTGMWGIINFDILQSHVLLLALFAAAMAMALQSSTATIGLAIGLGAAEVVTFRMAIPVVLGANVGLALTTLIVGWRHHEPRRLALANLLLKSVVAGLGLAVVALFGVYLWTHPFSYAAAALLGAQVWTPPVSFALGVAAVHTGYNIVVAAVGLPAVGVVTSLMERIVPVPPPHARKTFGPKYITEGPIGGVALAMGQSLREITHMSEIIRGMLHDAWTALKTNNERLARDVAERDDQIDLLDTEVKRFLTRLAREEAGEYDPEEQMRQLRYLAELETIGDIIDKNISELVLKKIRLGAEFSSEGAQEMEDFYTKVAENVEIAETAYATRDRDLAQQLLRHKERIDHYQHELRDRHFARLNAGLAEAHETSAIHLDLLTHLQRINSCVSHGAYAILQDTEPKDAPVTSGAGE
ncbi:MAG: Na/Pi cotransporter family protein [Planctomycetes bacterium]|nr:Na/Pi cotransporter family protein [Planctomycetota bacterium]